MRARLFCSRRETQAIPSICPVGPGAFGSVLQRRTGAGTARRSSCAGEGSRHRTGPRTQGTVLKADTSASRTRRAASESWTSTKTTSSTKCPNPPTVIDVLRCFRMKSSSSASTCPISGVVKWYLRVEVRRDRLSPGEGQSKALGDQVGQLPVIGQDGGRHETGHDVAHRAQDQGTRSARVSSASSKASGHSP